MSTNLPAGFSNPIRNGAGEDVYNGYFRVKGNYEVKNVNGQITIFAKDKGVEITDDNKSAKNYSVVGDGVKYTAFGGGDNVNFSGNNISVTDKHREEVKGNSYTANSNNSIFNTTYNTKANVTGNDNSIMAQFVKFSGNRNSISGTKMDDKIEGKGFFNTIKPGGGKDTVTVDGSHNTVISNDRQKNDITLFGDGTNRALSNTVGKYDNYKDKQVPTEASKNITYSDQSFKYAGYNNQKTEVYNDKASAMKLGTLGTTTTQ